MQAILEYREAVRRARDAMHRVQRTASDRRLHDWRKPTRALRYQLELVVGDRRGDARELRKAYGGLARELAALLKLRVFMRNDRTLVGHAGMPALLGRRFAARLAAASH